MGRRSHAPSHTGGSHAHAQQRLGTLAGVTPKAKSLLKDLYDCRMRGSSSQQVSGEERLNAAEELRKLGLVEWHGYTWGINFYYITKKGMEKYNDKSK
jgi:hypothetical protein